MIDINEDVSRDFKIFELKDPDNTKQKVSEIESLIKIDDESILCNTGQLEVLYELGKGLHTPQDGWIFEFGTYQGGSAAAIGTGLKESGSSFAPMATVDIGHLNSYHMLDGNLDKTIPELDVCARNMMKTREVIRGLDLDEYVATVIFDDHAFFDKFLRDKPIQFILHDSDHATQHVRDFLDLCFPYVMKDGWIGVHDYVHAEYSSLIPAVNEFINKMGSSITPYRIRWDCLVLFQKHTEYGDGYENL